MTRKLTSLLAGLLSLMAASSVSAQSELFMSEYVEGTSNNKAIEIFNGTGSAVNMTTGNYVLELYSNGSPTVTATVSLTATIANGDVYVLCHASAAAAVLAQCDLTSSTVINFNGDDAVVLRKGGAAGSVVDIIGQIGVDPGTAWSSGGNSTLNKTLRRKGEKCIGDTNPNDDFNPSIDWNTENVDTFTFLGSHTAACSTAGTLQFSSATYSVAENGGSATITVTRATGTTGSVTVQYTTSDGTTNPANQPGDYTTASGTLTFIDGDISETFSVTINDDGSPETDETVNLTLSVPGGGATLGAPSTAVLTITNDDAAPNLTINDVTLNEGNAGTQTYSFTVSLSSPAGASGVSFNIATADNTATDADNDYEPNSVTGATIASGNSTYTFDVTVNGDTTIEATQSFFVNITGITNAIGSDTQGVGTLTNDDVYRIHAIQGSGASSPMVGQTGIPLRGIVTAKSGTNNFFVQEEDSDADADLNTSEGIFVFRNSSSTPASPAVAVGDLVEVTGTVTEFVSSNADYFARTLTEITSPTIAVLGTGNALPTAINLNAALPVATTTYDSNTFERYEGMRVSSNDLDVVAATSGFIDENDATSTSTGEFFAVLGGVSRPFREPGIPTLELSHISNPFPGYGGPVFDGNPERLRINSDGLGGTLLDVDAGDAVSNVVGVMDSYFGNYSILPEPTTTPIVIPGSILAFARMPDSSEITVSGANLLRLFDTVNDPAKSDVVLTSIAFANRIAKTAAAICQTLNAPDIIGVVEVENMTVLNALAAAIDDIADSGCTTAPNYVAYLVEGNDPGGIDVGFMVKTADVAGNPRVQVNSVTQEGLCTLFKAANGSDVTSGGAALNGCAQNGTFLNDRPSLVLAATVHAANGNSEDITVIANHLRSLSGVNDSAAGSNGYTSEGARVRAKRQQQAEYLANLVQARQLANANERIVLVGDFNAFEFNDGYGDSMGTISGTPAPDSETVVANDGADLVNPDLINLASLKPASQRYSFSFDGSAQSLDHALVNQAANDDFAVTVDHARINADFIEEDFDNFSTNDNVIDDELTRISDHDPVVVYLSADSFKTADLAVAVVAPASPVKVGKTAQFGVGVSNGGPADSGATTLTLALDAANPGMTATAPAGWTCGAALVVAETSTVTCSTSNVVNGTTPSFNVNVPVTDALSHRTLILTATVAGTTVDPNPGNNIDSASITTIAEANLRTSFSGTSLEVRTGVVIPVYLRLDNYGTDSAVNVVVDIGTNAPTSAASLVTPSGWSCTATGTSTAAFRCTIGRFPRGTVLFTLKAIPPTSFAGSSINFTGNATSDSIDPVPGNNGSAYSLRVKASAIAPVTPPAN